MRKNESARNGQTIRTETAPDDRGSHKVGDGWKKMKGDGRDVSSSLSGGAKANVDYQKK